MTVVFCFKDQMVFGYFGFAKLVCVTAVNHQKNQTPDVYLKIFEV